MEDGVRPPRRAARQGLQVMDVRRDSSAENIEDILKELSEYIEHEV
jgi:hypothetical protein